MFASNSTLLAAESVPLLMMLMPREEPSPASALARLPVTVRPGEAFSGADGEPMNRAPPLSTLTEDAVHAPFSICMRP